MTYLLGVILAFLLGVVAGRYCGKGEVEPQEPAIPTMPKATNSHRYNPVSRRPEKLP